MWSKERVIAECEKISISMNDNFNIPVLINGRLVKTLGRVYSEFQCGKYAPTRMEISKVLLETASDADIIKVIQHEWAHYMVIKNTGEPHGHDKVFKAMCARIGCTNDGTSTDIEREEGVYKYTVICNTCKKTIGGYTRMCPTLRNIKNCWCKTCGRFDLSYVQNW
jgi:predicted SprT family Zn-dependent metalloprotease